MDKNEIILEQYKILYSTYQYNLNIFFKGTSYYFIIILAALGFIMKGEISPFFIKIISLIILSIGIGWYVANIFARKFAKKFENDLIQLSEKLDIKYYDVILYPSFITHKIVVLISIPVLLVFVYFLLTV